MFMKRSLLQKQIVGIAGVYFTAAELSRRGYVALITSRNLKTYDIIAYKPSEEKKVFPIQVKTRFQYLENIEKELTPSLLYCKGTELKDKIDEKIGDDFIFVFVYLYKDLTKRPRFFVVSAKSIKELLVRAWEDYLKSSKHKKPIKEIEKKEHPIMIPFKYLLDFEDRWDILE